MLCSKDRNQQQQQQQQQWSSHSKAFMPLISMLFQSRRSWCVMYDLGKIVHLSQIHRSLQSVEMVDSLLQYACNLIYIYLMLPWLLRVKTSNRCFHRGRLPTWHLLYPCLMLICVHHKASFSTAPRQVRLICSPIYRVTLAAGSLCY